MPKEEMKISFGKTSGVEEVRPTAEAWVTRYFWENDAVVTDDARTINIQRGTMTTACSS